MKLRKTYSPFSWVVRNTSLWTYFSIFSALVQGVFTTEYSSLCQTVWSHSATLEESEKIQWSVQQNTEAHIHSWILTEIWRTKCRPKALKIFFKYYNLHIKHVHIVQVLPRHFYIILFVFTFMTTTLASLLIRYIKNTLTLLKKRLGWSSELFLQSCSNSRETKIITGMHWCRCRLCID